MPIRHDIHGKSPSLKGAEAWFLKTAEDAVCGELTLGTLAEWAETGRILADHQISRNGETWVKAATVPELKMDWYATLKSGATHGPVNLLALPDMYRRGMIDATAVLRNKLTNREIPAAAILRGMRDPAKAPRHRPPARRIEPRPATVNEPSEADTVDTPIVATPLPGVRLKGSAPPVLAASPKRTGPSLPAAGTAPAAGRAAAPPPPPRADAVKRLEREVERLKKELRENKDRTDELLKQLADETALHEQLRARHAKTVSEMEAGLEEKSRQSAAAVEELAALKKRCAALEAANDRSREPADGGWHLRLQDGKLFGPVSEGELYAWAADCRIGPGQQVSRDRKQWQPVESIPELRMQWHVRLVNGALYGPLNAFAVPHLVREGVAVADAPLTNCEGGAEQPLADALVSEAAAVRKRAAERIEECRRQAASPSSSPPRTIRNRLHGNGNQ